MKKPDVLEKILARKRQIVEQRRGQVSLKSLESGLADQLPVRGFLQALSANVVGQQPAVIAEVKKASPSKGIIRENFDVEEIARSYEAAGACCLSVLTDVDFFQGSDDFLVQARQTVALPALRKDFIVDEYQVWESRALGADCILLIVSALPDHELHSFYECALQLNMDVLIEVHDRQELDRALQLGPKMIGINNRNLHTFETSLDTTLSLLETVPEGVLVVTESGIHHRSDVLSMLENGVYSFLVGESFMREADPGAKLRALFY